MHIYIYIYMRCWRSHIWRSCCACKHRERERVKQQLRQMCEQAAVLAALAPLPLSAVLAALAPLPHSAVLAALAPLPLSAVLAALAPLPLSAVLAALAPLPLCVLSFSL